MKKNNIHILKHISSYISKEINEQDFKVLKVWLEESPENKKLFSDYLFLYKKSRGLDFLYKSQSDQDLAWKSILAKLNNPINLDDANKKKTSKVRFLKKLPGIYKYAAVFICILGIVYFFKNENTLYTDDDIIIAEENITLELANGDTKVVDFKGELVDVYGNNVDFKPINAASGINDTNLSELLEYYTLKVPHGKNIQLQLPDGSLVHLNSGSVFKYPIQFVKGLERQVFLESGEAYFNVTKDKEAPFIVNSRGLNVRVLGTEFNVTAYQEDLDVNVVLVEGAVGVYKEGEVYNEASALLLKPGFKASLRKTKDTISVDEVDTKIYTGWKNNKLIFKNLQFKNILKKLERHYNVTIINNNHDLGEQYYNATFDIESIIQVLNSFSRSYSIDYEIIDNQIIIK